MIVSCWGEAAESQPSWRPELGGYWDQCSLHDEEFQLFRFCQWSSCWSADGMSPLEGQAAGFYPVSSVK